MANSDLDRLWRAAVKLGPARSGRKAPPPLLAFTDPVRTPDPEALARRLPCGAALVFRSFGAPEGITLAKQLVRISHPRGVKVLIGADVSLARVCGADGVHLPERDAHRARSARLRPSWLVTAAAHSLTAIHIARRAGVDAVVISAVFPSRSPSAGRPMGPHRLAAIRRAGGVPAYALGGVNLRTIRRLGLTGVIGAAAIEGASN